MLFYNSEILTAEEAPKDWADLTKEEYKDKIVVRDSLSSSMRSTICNLIDNTTTAQSEEAAWEYLKALDSNIKNYYNSGCVYFSEREVRFIGLYFSDFRKFFDLSDNIVA